MEFARVYLRNGRATSPAFTLTCLSLLKNLSDHRGCLSATATAGHARKFVRSRNPVTVIVKIESRDLDRAPDMGCPTQWVERDGSRQSDGAIDHCCGSGRATFVPMMESTDLGSFRFTGRPHT
jgi:hypothetical protein